MTEEIISCAEAGEGTLGEGEQKTQSKKRKPWTGNDWVLIGMASLSVVFLAVFAYAPLYGLVLAFKDGDGWLNISQAISVAKWCGFDNFTAFFDDPDFWNIILNTLGLNILQLLINFPLPILLRCLLRNSSAIISRNLCRRSRFFRTSSHGRFTGGSSSVCLHWIQGFPLCFSSGD